MKICLKAILSIIVILLAHHLPVNASNGKWSSFEEYKKSMNTKKLPLTLMVGCGHGDYYTDGDHHHLDCWSVNMKKDPSKVGFADNTEALFQERVQYDEILDISLHHIIARSKETREPLPLREGSPNGYSSNILGYKNTFDTVVLERPSSNTLTKPWTLWNAIHMLKVGGELIIDSTYDYKMDTYEKGSLLWKERSYPVNQSPEKLQKFRIKESRSLPANPAMVGISNYLASWKLNDIINIGGGSAENYAYQPYTKKPDESLETARKTCVFSATKTQETEDKMEEWSREVHEHWKKNIHLYAR